tara:strand:+ start:544 stop:747 length:204 start_codon:yes stop_codon:yes gene_type:complete
MDLDKFTLMSKLKPVDRWRLENMYENCPIPIEVIKGKIASYEGEPDIDNAYGYKGAIVDPRNEIDDD